ncbi:MAG: hypothetical protein ACLQU2_04520 [Candidatus Binataceae bacterium]
MEGRAGPCLQISIAAALALNNATVQCGHALMIALLSRTLDKVFLAARWTPF